jgi:hypothetical protein
MVENASFKIDPPKFTVDEGVVRYSSLRKVTMAYPVVMADVTGFSELLDNWGRMVRYGDSGGTMAGRTRTRPGSAVTIAPA